MYITVQSSYTLLLLVSCPDRSPSLAKEGGAFSVNFLITHLRLGVFHWKGVAVGTNLAWGRGRDGVERGVCLMSKLGLPAYCS